MKKFLLLGIFIFTSIYLDAQNIILYRRDTVGGAFGSGLVMTPNDVAVYVSTHASSVDTGSRYKVSTRKLGDSLYVKQSQTINGTAYGSGNITLTKSSFATTDSATNSLQGFMTGADHTKLTNLWSNAPLQDVAFTNDSIDCSRIGGTYYNSYTVASAIVLKGKINNRVTGGFTFLKLVGDGTNTITLGANMQYVDGAGFNNTLNKVNLVTIVWFKSLSKWIVYTNAY